MPTPNQTQQPVQPPVTAMPPAGQIPDGLAALENLQNSSSDPLAEAIQLELGKKLQPTSSISGNPLEDEPYTDDEIFRAVNLTKAYGQGITYNEVIKGISFTVRRGEYVVIYGPSGSGKSTLLHLIAGLEVPSRGEIRLRGSAMTGFSDEDIARYHREEVGLVFQSFNLLDSISVWENIAFPLMLSGAPYEWRRHEAMKLLERFSLSDFADRYPAQLSGGQQQRVAIARALAHDPSFLLIDEPTGNLDSKAAAVVLDEISRLHKQEGRTIILVTHSPDFLPYATRVFYIRDGTLLATPSTEHGTESAPAYAAPPLAQPTVQPTSGSDSLEGVTLVPRKETRA